MGDQRHVVPRPGDIEHVSVLGNGAADDDPRVAIDPGKDCVQRFTADVVEVHIDAVWRLTVEAVCDPFVLVVDDTIDVQRLLEPVTLLGSAGDTDDPRAEVARNLAGDRSNRPGGRRDHYRFPGLGLADVCHPKVCRIAGHPQS